MVDQTFVDQTDAQHPLVRRHPLHGRDLPRSRWHASRRRQRPAEPRHGAHLPAASPAAAPTASTKGPVAEAMVAAVQDPPVGPDAETTPGARPDDRGRRGRLHRARARAGTHPLPRPGHLGHGPALERRLDRRRGAQHPRGLPPPRGRPHQALHLPARGDRFAFADRNAYLADPAFFDVPLERPAVRLLRRRAARPHQGGRRPQTAACRRATPTTTRATAAAAASASATISHPRQSTTHLVVSDRKGTVVSYTFTIESTGGNGIVVPAGASCSTTS